METVTREVTHSTQHRILVTDKSGDRFSLFENLSYDMDTMETARKAHLKLGSHPIIQARKVRVTFEYGPWRDH